jgi:hypothetical protein
VVVGGGSGTVEVVVDVVELVVVVGRDLWPAGAPLCAFGAGELHAASKTPRARHIPAMIALVRRACFTVILGLPRFTEANRVLTSHFVG